MAQDFAWACHDLMEKKKDGRSGVWCCHQIRCLPPLGSYPPATASPEGEAVGHAKLGSVTT